MVNVLGQGDGGGDIDEFDNVNTNRGGTGLGRHTHLSSQTRRWVMGAGQGGEGRGAAEQSEGDGKSARPQKLLHFHISLHYTVQSQNSKINILFVFCLYHAIYLFFLYIIVFLSCLLSFVMAPFSFYICHSHRILTFYHLLQVVFLHVSLFTFICFPLYSPPC